jgi:sugar phosphate isomerase/epimerase
MIKSTAATALLMGLMKNEILSHSIPNEGEMFYKISLAQWSFHRALHSNKMDNLDFAIKASSMGFAGIEYVNQFFKDKAEDQSYLDKMTTIANDNNVKQLLIMIDNEGNLGDPDDAKRNKAVVNHHKWVHAAKHLGCHSIRVNAFGIGTRDEIKAAAIQGLGTLSEYAAKENINVIVENHGSYSSDGVWLSDVMKAVNLPNCGTLPDFGNFCVKQSDGQIWGNSCVEEYDRYKGVREMMPFAKAVSAKTHAFDNEGNETTIDYVRMMKIVKEFNYKGFVGIEYEGKDPNEEAGIMASKKLLEKVGKMIS